MFGKSICGLRRLHSAAWCRLTPAAATLALASLAADRYSAASCNWVLRSRELGAGSVYVSRFCFPPPILNVSRSVNQQLIIINFILWNKARFKFHRFAWQTPRFSFLKSSRWRCEKPSQCVALDRVRFKFI